MQDINRKRLEWLASAREGDALPPCGWPDMVGMAKEALADLDNYQWRPIETAPIEPWDKVPFYYRFHCLLRGRGHPINPPWVSSGFGYYVKPNGGGNKSRAAMPANILRWKNDLGVCEPTHWMPMPSGEIEGETNV